MKDLQTEWVPQSFHWEEVIDIPAKQFGIVECWCVSSPEPGLCGCEYEAKYGPFPRLISMIFEGASQ